MQHILESIFSVVVIFFQKNQATTGLFTLIQRCVYDQI